MTEADAERRSTIETAPARQADPTGRYVLHYGVLRTGRVLAQLRASAARVTSVHLDTGSVDITVPAGPGVRELWDAIPGGRMFWALEWTDGRRLIDAGPLWTRKADPDSLNVGGSSILSMLNRRLLVPDVPAAQIPANDVGPLTGDIGTIMAKAVAHVLALPDGDLPIVLPPYRAGANTRTYPGYELGYLGQRIRELSQVGTGTEFLLEPRFVTGGRTHIEWVLTTGTTDVPQLTSPPHEADGTAAQQRIVGKVTFDEDATSLGTHAHSKGGGQERATVLRGASDRTLLDAGWPRTDVDDSNNSLDGTEVQDYAINLSARSRFPARAVTVEVDAAWWWGQGGRLGDTVHLRHRHRIVGLIDLTSRVLAMEPVLGSPWVKLTLADTLAEDVT